MTTSPIERTAAAFAAEFGRWRADRGLTKKQLAAQMGFDPSYVSHVERGRHRPTWDFARRAELVLKSDGAIWRAFVEYDGARTAASLSRREPTPTEPWLLPGAGLVVEEEVATLSYRDGFYHCQVRRDLTNTGTEPVTRYLVRVSVNRYPQDREQSTVHHRAHPLALAEMCLHAHCDPASAAEPMRWRPKHDWDALKEIWLLFENEHGRFPLYPGEQTTIEYGYTVDEKLWGPWFQRAVRLPTRRLRVVLDLPAALTSQVWGMETSLAAGETPLRTPVARRQEGTRDVFEWGTEAPPLQARYRLEWRFRANGVQPALSHR